jgi:threonine/homoserine/homoserine lactone efflux protein
MLTDFIFPGIGIGLSAVSVPGPLTAYLLNVTLRFGWRRALFVIFSPLIVDTPIIIAVLLLLDKLQAIVPAAIGIIRLLGGLLLLWIAWGAYRQFRAGKGFDTGDTEAVPETPGQIFRKAMLMNVVSPGPYLFWTTVNGPLLLKALNISLLHALAFLVAFYGTFLGGLLLVAFIFDKLGQINPRATRWMLALTIVLMVFFGGRLIIQGLTGN